FPGLAGAGPVHSPGANALDPFRARSALPRAPERKGGRDSHTGTAPLAGLPTHGPALRGRHLRRLRSGGVRPPGGVQRNRDRLGGHRTVRAQSPGSRMVPYLADFLEHLRPAFRGLGGGEDFPFQSLFPLRDLFPGNIPIHGVLSPELGVLLLVPDRDRHACRRFLQIVSGPRPQGRLKEYVMTWLKVKNFLPIIMGSLLLTHCSCDFFGTAGALLISEDDEVELGREFDLQLRTKDTAGAYPIYVPRNAEETAFQNYVLGLAEEVLAAVPAKERPDYDFTFTLIDKDVENAFAVPGGYVYIY